MAVTINASTTAGLVNTADTSGILQLQTANTTAVTVDASQNVSTTNGATIQGLTVGRGAGAVSTNTAVGASALQANTTGSNSTAVGYQAGYSGTTAYSNSYFGRLTGYSTTTAYGSTFIGAEAGYNNTTGVNNTYVGTGAGYASTTGSKNTIIGGFSGNQGGLDIRTLSNYIVLSDGDGNPRGYFNDGGYLQLKSPITTNSGAAQVAVVNTGAGTGYAAVSVANTSGRAGYLTMGDASATSAYFMHAGDLTLASTLGGAMYFRVNANDSAGMLISTNGSIGAPTGTNIYNASDARLKKNIQPLTKGLDAINALKPVSFNWITDFCKEENDKTLYGFVAQDTREVDENLVEGFNNGGDVVVGDLTVEKAMRVNEKFIIPMLVKAIQEQQALITQLQADVATLKGTP